MKKSLKFLAALLAIAGSSALVQAEAAVKLALVDVAKAWESHYSIPEQNEKIKAYNDKAQAQFDAKVKEGQAMAEKYKELEAQAGSPLLKDDAKKKLAEEGEALVQEIQKKEQEVQEFRQNAQNQINQAIVQFRTSLVEQISKIATDVAKKKGANLVIDKSAANAAGFPIVIFSDSTFDITDDVIAEINKGKPASVAKPAAAAPATAAPAAPATEGAGGSTIQFPGAKK